jgi:hypothetical protein
MWMHRDIWEMSMFPKTAEVVFEQHKDHCFLILMKKIMCEGDTSPVLITEMTTDDTKRNWQPQSVPHRCRNYGEMVGWIQKHEECDLECLEGRTHSDP